MANRGATAAVRAEWGKDQNRVAHLFEAHFDGGVIRTTDAFRAIVWNGNTYLALAHFLDFDGVEETLEMREGRVRVTLSGVDQQWIANALGQDYIDRRLVIYKAFLNDAGEALIDPIAIFDGRMDAMGMTEDPGPQEGTTLPGIGNCTVSVEAASAWADFGRRPGRHSNDAEHRLLFPGDRFFRFASQQTRNIQWGKATSGQLEAHNFRERQRMVNELNRDMSLPTM